MSDDLGLFERSDGSAAPRPSRRSVREARERARRRRQRRRVVIGAAVLVVLLGLAAAGYAAKEWRELSSVPDFAGPGGPYAVVEVVEGDSTSAIAGRLAKAGVVASPRAFLEAAESHEDIRSVQPGYYRVRTQISGDAAAESLIDPASRVGQLEIRGGDQLDDVILPDGTVVPGVLSLISKASCAELGGRSTCVSAEQLRATMANTDPAELGVPSWALDEVAAADPNRGLEGLIVPGTYDVRPGMRAPELLRTVVKASSARLQAAGMPGQAQGVGLSPYQLLVVASLIEREAVRADFAKVSRVIYNRLAIPMPLQFDSTINYPLDRQQVRTSPQDRATPGPYNSYLNQGLPPTPIGSPSKEALLAALRPAPGNWLYFVKCETNGLSCFNATVEQHNAAVRDAVARGVF